MTDRSLIARCTPLAQAAALVLSGGLVVAPSQAQDALPESPAAATTSAATPASSTSPRLSFSLPASTPGKPSPSGGAMHDGKLPLYFEADRLEGASGEQIRAIGSVKLKQGELTVRADELVHTQADNRAKASGHVRIVRQGNVFEGPELQLDLDTMEGEFIRPTYWFSRVQAGGQAQLIEFEGTQRLTATRASYTSCTPENTLDREHFRPAWELTTSKVKLDFDRHEGQANNAVVWFQGVPILAAPVLTFPLDDERKSGWLPPNFDYDNRGGFELAVPYYWNIAPNYDATLTPIMAVKRGTGLDGQFRFLLPSDQGTLRAFTLPNDQLLGKSRGLIDLHDQGSITLRQGLALTSYDLRWRRVSDDDYWKDFPRNLPSLTPRLYDSHVQAEHLLTARNWGLGSSQTSVYGSVQEWQTLRDLDAAADPALAAVEAPYGRRQIGLQSRSTNEHGFVWRLQGELNRFTNHDTSKPTGTRLHAVAQVERLFGSPHGVMLLPRLSLNSASYDMDQPLANGNRQTSRTIPTFSLESSAVFERPVSLFNQSLLQTLEPRVRYVRTPYVDQSNVPLFDSVKRDFNLYSIYSDNAYTGVDRISDANHMTLGFTSRLLQADTGMEVMRLGAVQKVLLADQRINPDSDQPITQRLSDIWLSGSTTVVPHWNFGSSVQLSAQEHRAQQAQFGAGYSPGPWRTVNFNYLYNRGNSALVDLGWQWPIAGQTPNLTRVFKDPLAASGGSSGSSCGGTWYTVGKLNYSVRDARLASSLLGIEYDAGCWIARVVSERVSVGRTDANSRIMFQLELVGLSRIGSSPLRALRENIPGYRLLRESNSLLPSQGSQPYYTDD